MLRHSSRIPRTPRKDLTGPVSISALGRQQFRRRLKETEAQAISSAGPHFFNAIKGVSDPFSDTPFSFVFNIAVGVVRIYMRVHSMISFGRRSLPCGLIFMDYTAWWTE